MKSLDWLKTAFSENTAKFKTWSFFFLLTLAPLAACFLEPRTFVFEGYFGSPAASIALGGALAAAVLCGLYTSFIQLPLSLWGFIWVLSALSLSAGNHSMVWKGFLIAALVAATSAIVSKRFRWVEWIGKASMMAALCLGTLGLADFIFEQFLTGRSLGPSFARFVSFLFPSLTHYDSAPSLSTSFHGETHLSRLGLDKVGGLYLVAFSLLIVTISGALKRTWWHTVQDLAVAIVYSLIVGFYLILRAHGNVDHFWFEEWPWAVAYSPLSLWLAVRLSTSEKVESFRLTAFSWAPTLIGCLFIALGISVWGPTEKRSGRVVIDEAHGDWETTKIPLDTKVFGGYTTYNYRNLYEELRRTHRAEIAEKELTPEQLRDVSVLVLKTPTKPYSEGFIHAVENFVYEGGGLWLIGDHTDAFGMSTYLNKVADRFKVGFRKNAWFEPPVKRNLWAPNTFTDPVARDLDTFLFYTGCEIDTPFFDKRVMVGRRNIVEDADYSAGSFFGPLRISPDNDGGSVAMSAMGLRGKGRIALWSDSTLFSNFSIYSPGKLEVALNTVEWLGRTHSYPYLRWVLLGFGILLLLAGLRPTSGSVFGISALVAVSLIPAVEEFNRRSTRVWSRDECLSGRLIAFYDPLKSANLPVYVSVDEASSDHYLSSFAAAQRCGLRPFYAEEFERATKARTIVVIPIRKAWDPKTIGQLADWTAQGGELIVLDGGNDGGLFVRQLFAANKDKSPLSEGEAENTAIVDASQHVLGDHPAYTVTGVAAAPLKVKGSGLPIAGRVPFGKGKAFISGSSRMFSDLATGYVLDLPTQPQFGVLSALFDVYNDSASAKGKAFVAR